MAGNTDKLAAPQNTSAAANGAAALDVPQQSKTKQLVGGIQGFDAQAAALAPQDDKPKAPVAPNAKDAPAPVSDEKSAEGEGSAAAAGAGPEALSPLREALLEQFRLMDGKGVGDAEFEAICGKTWWEDRKKSEAAAKKYNTEELPVLLAEWQTKAAADPAWAKANPKPVRKDDSVFTTCIATQGKLLQAAFKATGQHVKGADVKYDVFGYATMGRIEATKRDAWTESKPGIGQRPQRGDVLVLEMRGGADKVQKDIDGENSQFSMNAMGQKKLEKQIAQLQTASAGANEAAAKAANAKLPELEAKLAELRASHDKKIAELQVKLDEARAKTEANAGTEKSVKGGGRMGGLEFSHVGMFNGMAPEMGADGKATGREVWTTFDGGQNVPGKVNDQGAKSCTRLYDPKTNEIASASKGAGGAMTQDGKTRWLGGWVNIDKLVDPNKTDAKKK